MLATLDSKTSEICQEQDGKQYRLEEARVGETCPPFHPWCRSITIPVVEGLEIQHRTARDPSTGKTISVPGDMTYGEWKKGVEASGNAGGVGGILGEEKATSDMYRKTKDNNYVEAMPKKQLQKIVKAFKKQGGIIQMNDETEAYLERNMAEGVTLNENTILLRQKPGRASVYEELIHAAQYRQGLNDGSIVSRLENEIAAQKLLLKNSKAYELTVKEIEQTRRALTDYSKELKKRKGVE